MKTRVPYLLLVLAAALALLAYQPYCDANELIEKLPHVEQLELENVALRMDALSTQMAQLAEKRDAILKRNGLVLKDGALAAMKKPDAPKPEPAKAVKK